MVFLANKLMHPSSRIEREYAVRVLGDVQPSCLDAMKSGVVIDNTLMKFSDIQKSSTRETKNERIIGFT